MHRSMIVLAALVLLLTGLAATGKETYDCPHCYDVCIYCLICKPRGQVPEKVLWISWETFS